MSKYANLTIEHCYSYIRSLHSASVCGIRGNPWETLIARVAKFTTGAKQGYAYDGGDLLWTPDGYKRLSWSVADIAQGFEDCTINDLDAYDVDECGITSGRYQNSESGKWYWRYHHLDCLKAYSPDVYRKYYKRPQRKKVFALP